MRVCWNWFIVLVQSDNRIQAWPRELVEAGPIVRGQWDGLGYGGQRTETKNILLCIKTFQLNSVKGTNYHNERVMEKM